jgi:hypothetical protein
MNLLQQILKTHEKEFIRVTQMKKKLNKCMNKCLKTTKIAEVMIVLTVLK